MRQKILVIALGGTIGSTRDDTIHPDENNLKILDALPDMDTDYEAVSLFNILSENMNREYLRKLFDCLNGVNFSDYNGVIILHGSDTLAYTAAFLGNAYGNEHIVLVASDKPIEAADSNGIKNFCDAVTHIKSDIIVYTVIKHSCAVYISESAAAVNNTGFHHSFPFILFL